MIATEKVVEYYFQEEKKEAAKTPNLTSASAQAQLDKRNKRSSAGGTTWTTLDDTLSDESGSNELSKIRRKMKRLDINSDFDALSGKLESPKS